MPSDKFQDADNQLLEEIKRGSHKSFTVLFQTYYKNLVFFAGTIIKDRLACEDIVQNIFLKLWNDRENLSIDSSLKSYLLRAVRNSCIDEIRHKEVVDNYINIIFSRNNKDYITENYVFYSDLNNHLKKTISKLPEKQKEAFLMSRYKEMKYREIAEALNVSERTVEDRISKALSSLRLELKDFLLILAIIILSM